MLDIVRAAAAGGGVPTPPLAVGGLSWRSPAVSTACSSPWEDPTGSGGEGGLVSEARNAAGRSTVVALRRAAVRVNRR